jgi:hypothetical protein
MTSVRQSIGDGTAQHDHAHIGSPTAGLSVDQIQDKGNSPDGRAALAS